MKVRLLRLALTSLLILPLQAEAQQVNLRATVQVAVTDPFMGVSLVRFKEEVERQSDKAISVEIFEKGKLYIDDQVVDAVSSGAIEIGVAGLYQFAKKLPALDIMEQPFLFNFDALVRAAVSPDSEVRRMIDAAIVNSVGIRILWWQSLGNQVFVSKGRNVTDPHHIKGQRIRVFGDTTAQLAKHCGGTPVILSAFKMHDALRDNELDMVMCAISAVTNRELWKVADTITRTWHAPIEYVAFINEKTWQSLSSNQKTLVLEAARKAELEVREKVTEVEAKYYDFARGKGMKIHELTPDQVAEWRACSADVLDGYMNNNADLARQLMAVYGKLRTDPCCSTGPQTGRFNRH